LYAFPDTVWSASALLESFLMPPVAEPGERWEYSAANYLLLGMIAEQVTDRPIAEQIRTHLLTPLGLKNSFLYPQEPYDSDRMAHLWMPLDSSGIPFDVNALFPDTPLSGLFSSVWTAGAMHATALDAARFLRALFGGEVLSKESLQTLTEPAPESGDVRYGLGIATEKLAGVEALGHSGGIGYSSVVLYIPVDRLSISVLCNSQTDPGPIATALYSAMRAFPDQPHDVPGQ
jgi:D-alanyl-D-alanine carboxypeptidase